MHTLHALKKYVPLTMIPCQANAKKGDINIYELPYSEYTNICNQIVYFKKKENGMCNKIYAFLMLLHAV